MPRHPGVRRLRGAGAWRAIPLLLIALLPGCRKAAGPPALPPPLVTTAEVVVRDVPVYLDEIGACVALDTVAIQPQASGRITEIHFVDGVEVKKGDMLFTIDPRPYQAALDQAKAGLAQNRAALALAKLDYERAQRLLPNHAISQEDFDTRQNTVAVDEALVQASQAAIEAAQVNLSYCFIHSPVDGLTGKHLLDEGNVVAANSGVTLLTIQRMDTIYADFTVTERELAAVRRDMAKGTLKTYVRLPDDPEPSAREGSLTFLDNTVQASAGTVALRATMPNADRHFWPGQFVNVRLVLHIDKDAALVPVQATQVSQKGSFVYVLKPDSTVELRVVKLGQPQGEMVVVTEGVKPGEKVITGGQLTLAPGRKVRVEQPTSQASSASAQAASAQATQGAGASRSEGPAEMGGRP